MRPVPEIDVNLSEPPDRRWEQLATFRSGARDLLQFYVRDIGGLERFGPLLMSYRDAYVEPEYVAEMRCVARILDAPEEEVVLANLYYDAIKFVLSSNIVGCTGFAIDTAVGPLHARNLDWTTADGRLASQTVIVNYRRDSGTPLYRVVGWPGFIGCLSGVAPERFAVTLNAVISDDAPGLAPPISFVLRRALETARGFEEAVTMLSQVKVASDSLLLVSGTSAGEMAVVERSPTRGAIRGPSDGFVVATNDYRALSVSGDAAAGNALAATSCSRHDRAEQLLRAAPPLDADACLEVLRDPGVRMQITVQQMVLSATTGRVRVEIPPGSTEAPTT